MNLSIRERLMTLKVLPNPEVMMNLYLCLSFTDDEIEDLNIVVDPENGQMSWVGDRTVDIPIDEKGMAIITKAFKNARREKRLLPDAMSAYRKFVAK